MATVQLSDIIDIVVFRDLPAENEPISLAFFESGIIARSPLFDELANSPGRTAELPYWNDISSSSEPNYSSDQAVDAAPDKTDQEEQISRKAHLNNGWSAMDLSRELGFGTDAMQHIRNRVDAFWMKQWQKRLVNTSIGVFNNNVANDSGDMVHDIAIENGDAATSSEKVSHDAIVEAVFTMGDRFDDVTALAVHSVVYKNMVKQNLISFIQPSTNSLQIPTYLGKRVVISDEVPKIAGSSSGFKYLTCIWGPAAFGYGEGTPTVATEVYRDPHTGHGGGEEQLWDRKTWLIHPFGHTNAGATATANANQQSLADLTAADNWTRTLERKNVPFAYLVTNG